MPIDRMSRPTARACLALLFLALLPAVGCSDPAAPARPNLVVVSLDTLRADHLGLYGYERGTSPHLDALAETAVVFDNAFSHSTHTAPAHRALFQSRVVSRTGADQPVLAEVLGAAGYRTAAFTGAGKVSAKLGFDRGFALFHEDIRGFGASFPRIERWLREEAETPFFLFLHTYDIHLPYDPPPPFDTQFAADGYAGPVEGPRTRELVRKTLRLGEWAHFEGDLALDASDRAQMVALYDGGIRYTDQFIGRLEAVLRERGLWEDTVVVVTADHGEEFWDHDSLAHGLTLYQEVLRVPLVVRWPGAPAGVAGRRVPDAVRLMDVAPSLLELAGVAPPPGFQGRSLVPWLRGETLPPAPVLAELAHSRTWIRHPWKLIHHPREKRSELFELASDPGEQTDLAAERPGRRGQLESELRQALAAADRNPVEPVNPTHVADDELREQLRALGYVE
jgi:arylsulfatase A-like enzyme